MQSIKIIVPGAPQGKARARTGYNPKVKRITSYTPEKTVLYENLIKTCYIDQSNLSFKNEEPLEVCIVAFYEPVKSVSKKRRKEMINGMEFPTKKPDSDNIAKVILDALNGIAYGDDKQVVSLTVTKLYDETARVEIEIGRFTI